MEKVIYRDLPHLFKIKDIAILKKYYPAIISDLIYKDDDISRSKVFEWLIVTRLDAGFFWRDSYKNEVDVIVPEKIPIPIEIKYGKLDTSDLIAFMKKFKITEGYIISSENEKQIKIGAYTINVIPAFKFLSISPEFLQASIQQQTL